MKNLISLISLVLLLVTLLVLAACAKQEVTQQVDKEIVIGLLDDLSGPLAGTFFPRSEWLSAVRSHNACH